MPSSYRYAYLALVGGLVAFALLAVFKPFNQRISEPADYHGEQSDTQRLAHLDYIAQRRMADAAFWQIGISFLGLMGLAATVHFARKAWKESQIGAKAAVDAATHAGQSVAIIRRQSKAYVHGEKVTFRKVSTGALSRPELVLTMRNVGGTVATEVTVDYEVTFSAAAYMLEWDGKFASRPLQVLASNIAPSDETTARLIYPHRQMTTGDPDDVDLAIVRGIVHYADVFGERWLSAFWFYTFRFNDGIQMADFHQPPMRLAIYVPDAER